jgi:putative cell wall-binding protein
VLLASAAALAAAGSGVVPSPAQAAPGPRFGENYVLPPIAPPRGRDVPGLAVDPANPNHIVEAEGDPINLQCDYNVSFDGGRTWSGGRLTNVAGQDPPFPTPACDQNFDSGGYAHFNTGIVFGSGQNVYITFSVHRGAFNRPESNLDGGFGDDAVVARSTDGGRTFAPATLALPGGGPVQGQPGLAGFGMRPQLAVERGAGTSGQDRLYLASWNCFIRVRASQTGRGGCSGGGGDRRIFVSRSNDSGTTWGTPVLASAAAVRTGGAIAEAGSPDEQAIEPSQPVVGPDGAIYVAYRNRDITNGTTCPANPAITNPAPNTAAGFPANLAHCIVVARSTNGGTSWSQFSTGIPMPTGSLRNPRLAIDPATPAGVGTLYVVYQRPVGTDPSDIMLQRSTDRGATWSPAVRVNDDPAGTSSAATFTQTNPNVSVGPGGRVDVIWGDKRNSYPGAGTYGDIYYASSTNGGTSFSPNRRITDRTINFAVGRAGDTGSAFDPGFSWYGPVSLPLADGSVLAAFMDSRTGNVDDGIQDIFLSRMTPGAEVGTSTIATASSAGLSVRLSRLAYPGGAEALAPGEPATRVVVVNEGDAASALAGAVLARANLGSLLVSPVGGLPAIVKAEAARLRPTGAYVLGGPSSLSAAVSSDLRDVTRGGENVVRLGAASNVAVADRAADVARQVAEQLRPLPGASPEAVIVNPATPEAASAAALAAALRLPILFVDARTTAPGPTTAAISSLGIKKALIVGGTQSVNAGVQGQLNTLLGEANVRRLDGANQYETSDKVLAESRTRGLPANVVYVADGTRPVEAGVLGAAVARLSGLMLLTPSAGTAAAQTRLTALGVEPLVDRVVSAVGTGGTDPAPPEQAAAPPAAAPAPAGAAVSPPPPPPPAAAATPPAPRVKAGFTARVTPGTDMRAPFRFTVSGRLTLPAGIARTVGCKGPVSVQIKRGGTTISTRRVFMHRGCTYSSTVSFATARRFGITIKQLRFSARFLGNGRILPATAGTRFARVRR